MSPDDFVLFTTWWAWQRPRDMTLDDVETTMNPNDLTLAAASEYMLARGYEVFSKKQCPDTGRWWIILEWPKSPVPSPYNLSNRPKQWGDSLADAVEAAFEFHGWGGLAWKIAKLEGRVRALRDLIDPPKAKRTCPHGVSGGRCRQCV